MRTPAVLLAAAFAATACGGAKPKPAPVPEPVAAAPDAAPAAPAEPPIVEADAPDSVLAIASVPDPGATIDAIVALSNAVEPGSATGLTTATVPLIIGSALGIELDGVDASQPMWWLFVDNDENATPVAFVMAVADGVAFERSLGDAVKARVHDGYAVFGDAAVVDQVASFALTKLRAGAVLEDPSLLIRMPQVMARYGTYISQFKSMLRMQLASDTSAAGQVEASMAVADAFERVLADSTAWRFGLRVGSDGIEVRLDVQLAPDTSTNAIAAGGTRAAYKWVPALPAGTPLVVLAADVGGADSWLASWLSKASAYAGSADAARITKELAGMYTGETAMAFDLDGGMTIAVAADVGDDAKAMLRKAYASYARLRDEVARYRKLRAYRVDGVSVDQYSATLNEKAVPAEQLEVMRAMFGKEIVHAWAVHGGALAMASGPKVVATRTTKRLIGAIKSGAKTPNPVLTAMADDSRANGEMGFVAIDLARFPAFMSGLTTRESTDPGYVIIGVGSEAGHLRFRVSASALAVRAVSAASALQSAKAGAELVVQFDELADRACACKDADCAKKIGEDMMAILEGVDKDDEPSAENQKKIMDAMDRIQVCTTKVIQAN